AKLRKRLMAKAKRNIGLEILEGIREIKRGEHGRVITVPPVSACSCQVCLSSSVRAMMGVGALLSSHAEAPGYSFSSPRVAL
ncbi:MAG: hypothetical protein ND866_29260, partial [Pyrinomonadaceae bacterium]|nr:hypothetical protein [Pyrinomonadaceae bacterium]